MYKNLFTSRGDGNALRFNTCKKFISCIRTYLPREGTETYWYLTTKVTSSRVCIRTYLPREGTETHFLLYSLSIFVTLYKNLSTSRGDGNTSTTGLNEANYCIRTYLPREGTETSPIVGIYLCTVFLYKNLSTSRGDGNPPGLTKLTTLTGTRIRTYPPREGTETPQSQFQGNQIPV